MSDTLILQKNFPITVILQENFPITEILQENFHVTIIIKRINSIFEILIAC